MDDNKKNKNKADTWEWMRGDFFCVCVLWHWNGSNIQLRNSACAYYIHFGLAALLFVHHMSSAFDDSIFHLSFSKAKISYCTSRFCYLNLYSKSFTHQFSSFLWRHHNHVDWICVTTHFMCSIVVKTFTMSLFHSHSEKKRGNLLCKGRSSLRTSNIVIVFTNIVQVQLVDKMLISWESRRRRRRRRRITFHNHGT